jgi:EpsI family protein
MWKHSYQKEAQQVGLYIAYYRQQSSQSKLVSSENVLAQSGDAYWAIVEHGTGEYVGLPVRTAHLRGGTVGTSGEQRLRVWQWYWVDGQLTASDVKAKLLTLKSRLSGRGDDGAIIVLYTSEALPGDADAALADFATAARDGLDKMLAQLKEQG